MLYLITFQTYHTFRTFHTLISLFPSRAVALSLGPIAIHWYGILYLLGFLIGVWLLPRIQRYRNITLNHAQRESLLFHVFLGVLLGGRLGFVLFYGGSFYLDHPLEIFAVWHGGMSSHGGFIGVTLALVHFARKNGIDLFALTDILVIPIAIGLALGRLGNLINGELYGTLTTLPWGMQFPGAEGSRHPTQIYAIIKDLFIAFACFRHLKITSSEKDSSGKTTALFLMLYAVLRFIVEIFRDQPYGYTQVLGLMLSRGQLLTVPVFLIGFGIWCWRKSSKK